MEAKLNKFEQELLKRNPKDGAYLDSMLSRFNRQVQEYGLFRELKRREHYNKPSVARSKKKHNKKLKSRMEANAVRKGRVQTEFRQRYTRASSRPKGNARYSSRRMFKLRDNKTSR